MNFGQPMLKKVIFKAVLKRTCNIKKDKKKEFESYIDNIRREYLGFSKEEFK